jgi:hypothetical protein
MIPTAGFKMQPFDLSSCLVFLFLIIDGINSNENNQQFGYPLKMKIN